MSWGWKLTSHATCSPVSRAGAREKTRLLDLVEKFTLFSEHKAGLVKIIGQSPHANHYLSAPFQIDSNS